MGMQKVTNKTPEGLARVAERLLGAGVCPALGLEGGREGDALGMRMLNQVSASACSTLGPGRPLQGGFFVFCFLGFFCL